VIPPAFNVKINVSRSWLEKSCGEGQEGFFEILGSMIARSDVANGGKIIEPSCVTNVGFHRCGISIQMVDPNTSKMHPNLGNYCARMEPGTENTDSRFMTPSRAFGKRKKKSPKTRVCPGKKNKNSCSPPAPLIRLNSFTKGIFCIDESFVLT
jgi:hypothetical protein